MKKTWISEDKSQKYIGEFDGENKHGQGTYFWVGLLEISGKFENDKLPNYGTIIKYDDYEYTGEMKNRDGRFNGKGVLKSLNPKFTYEGEFENGELEGYGILTQDSGVYEGNFKKGLKHGKGTIMAGFLRTGEKKGQKFIVDGGPLTGKFKNDIPVGIFIWEMKSGRRYVGEINKGGYPEGKGILTHPDGEIENGIFKNGELIKPSQSR
jgi:hypothetical protein